MQQTMEFNCLTYQNIPRRFLQHSYRMFHPYILWHRTDLNNCLMRVVISVQNSGVYVDSICKEYKLNISYDYRNGWIYYMIKGLWMA